MCTQLYTAIQLETIYTHMWCTHYAWISCTAVHLYCSPVSVSSYCRTNSDQWEPKQDNLHEPHNNMIISVMSVLAKWFTTFLKWASWWMFMSKFLLKGISYHNCNAHELKIVCCCVVVFVFFLSCSPNNFLILSIQLYGCPIFKNMQSIFPAQLLLAPPLPRGCPCLPSPLPVPLPSTSCQWNSCSGLHFDSFQRCLMKAVIVGCLASSSSSVVFAQWCPWGSGQLTILTTHSLKVGG